MVNQMFFDNQRFFDFVERCRAAEIHVPIIRGLKPLTTAHQLGILPQTYQVDLTEKQVKLVDHAKTRDQVKEVGIAWCTQQAEESLDYGVTTVHYDTWAKSSPHWKSPAGSAERFTRNRGQA